LNVSAAVEMQIEALGDSTRYAQIVALMDHASLVKPRLALLADRMARPFLLGVLLAAGAAGAWWWSQSPAQALMVAVSVLIVTCPCALSLATPAAMLAAAGRLARQGILVRELQSLEALTQIDTVVFDKTGTLTRDGQRLDRQWTAPGVDARQALHCAASLASHSWHPLSRALVQAWQDEAPAMSGVEPDTPTWLSVLEVPGKGLEATLAGEADDEYPGRTVPDHQTEVSARRFRLGSWAFGHEGLAMGQAPADAEQAQVHLFAGSRWVASFSLSEDLRDDVPVTLQGLQQLGLSVHLLSGDRPAAVAALAARVGLPPDVVHGGCSPADKLRYLETLQQAGHRVLMVGDGLNDGPVMAAAHVSMAVGAAVPLTQARADFVLMGEQLAPVVQTLTLSRLTLRVVRQNLVWAAVYNALCVPLAMAGWLPAWLAGLGMALSSIGVVLHSLRLGRPLAREHIPLSVTRSTRFKPQIV
jgi:Cu2+-exporting ATPase